MSSRREQRKRYLEKLRQDPERWAKYKEKQKQYRKAAKMQSHALRIAGVCPFCLMSVEQHFGKVGRVRDCIRTMAEESVLEIDRIFARIQQVEDRI